MRKITLLIALLLTICLQTPDLFAQAPQRINYQAVIRSASGLPIVSQPVSLRFSILEGSASGTPVYVETQSVTTNSFGLANVQIGSGAAVTGTFSGITWNSGNKFLKVEADVTGGTTYANLATVEMISVPFALNAEKSNDNRWTTTGNNISNNNAGNVGIGGAPNASAQLDVAATNKGVLIPRISQANRPASPVDGLLIYQTDNTPGFYYYNAGSWKRMVNSTETGASGSIIPFASGTPVTVTTVAGGLVGTTALLGFGNANSGVSLAGGNIDLTGAGGTLLNFSFVAPRAGTITSIAAHFSNTAALSLIGTNITLTAQLYAAPAGSNTFSPVPGASVTLSPSLTALVTIGTTSTGVTSGLSIPVTAGTRYLLVYSATATGITLVNSVTGYASAGININ